MRKAKITRELFRGQGRGWMNPLWQRRFPWLVQGVTGGETRKVSRDFALGTLLGTLDSGSNPASSVYPPWSDLLAGVGLSRLVLCRQVHGREVRVRTSLPRGVHVKGKGDGHVSAEPGLLLGITVADCVPVFLVDPKVRAVALLHAGWRGVAAGILEEGLHVLARRFGSLPSRLHMHLGPSIRGECYEVGPEVHEALDLSIPPGPEPLDLHRVLAERARESGIPPEQISESAWCTRCGNPPFFSHRGGDSERQLVFVGIRDGPQR